MTPVFTNPFPWFEPSATSAGGGSLGYAASELTTGRPAGFAGSGPMKPSAVACR